MCGRLFLTRDFAGIEAEIGARWSGPNARFDTHWDVGAGQYFPVIRSDRVSRYLDMMRWGLVVAWANDTMVVSTTVDCHDKINETAPRYDGSWSVEKRCLVLADRVYDWRKDNLQPFAMTSADHGLMTMGAIWEQHTSSLGKRLSCFAILVTEAAGEVAQVCQHMPVIIPREARGEWLGEETTDTHRITKLLSPHPDNRLIVWQADQDAQSSEAVRAQAAMH